MSSAFFYALNLMKMMSEYGKNECMTEILRKHYFFLPAFLSSRSC